jgi:hypothetical protein
MTEFGLVKLEILAVVTVKNTDFWDMTPCGVYVVYGRFEKRAVSIFRVKE